MNMVLKNFYTVDVIIPVYNGEKFIGDALDSVLAQTYTPHQIIVVDDGSTDNTKSIIAQYQGLKVPVVYIQKENGGPNSARNIGIKSSNADILAFLDADDFWNPTKLEKQVNVFKDTGFKNLGVVYCDICPVDIRGEKLQRSEASFLKPDIRGMIFKKLIHDNYISGSASGVLIKRKCFQSVGLFEEKLRTAEDWEMWLRLAEVYQFDYVREKLVYLRQHEDNASRGIYQMILGRILVLAWLSKKYPEDCLILNELRYHICRMIVYCLPEFNIINHLRTLIGYDLWKRVFDDKLAVMATLFRGLTKILRKHIS